MKIKVSDAAKVLGTVNPAGDLEVSRWSTDTRTIKPGEAFVALRGPNHDGNAYVQAAFAKGASIAVADRPVEADGPVLRVEDSLAAMQKLAAWARERWGGTVIGVTGSAGKTTTKDVIAAILGSQMRVGKTAGNYNNHIGVPLSVLHIPDDAQAAVLEIGMNHAGEIRELSKIAQPQVGVVTNVGYAHVENFGSIEGVTLAKRELVESLPKDGIAILNADDPRVAEFQSIHAGRTITFGLSEPAEVRARNVVETDTGARFEVDGVVFETRLAGRHGVSNILAGLAVARALDVPLGRLTEAVKELQPGQMRGERIVRDGITIWNDCYNSNPEAVRVMVDLLRSTPARRRIAVLGEMLELGRLAETLHREVGSYVAKADVSVLVGIRGAAKHMVDAAIEAGLGSGAAYFFDEPEEAGRFLKTIAREGDAVLFKGSRGTHVERALERFLS